MKIYRNKKEKVYAKVAISNRHVHMTKEVYEKLFEEPLSIKRPLNQIGEFASFQTVTLKTDKDIIENVRVVGPFRDYTQVEISRSDALKLGIEPPVRQSGDLEDSETITIIGPKGEITLKDVCIIAERHIHMNEKKALELGFKNEDLVNIRVLNDKGGTMEACVKISKNGYYEVHIDKDDANAFLLNNGDEVTIER